MRLIQKFVHQSFLRFPLNLLTFFLEAQFLNKFCTQKPFKSAKTSRGYSTCHWWKQVQQTRILWNLVQKGNDDLRWKIRHRRDRFVPGRFGWTTHLRRGYHASINWSGQLGSRMCSEIEGMIVEIWDWYNLVSEEPVTPNRRVIGLMNQFFSWMFYSVRNDFLATSIEVHNFTYVLTTSSLREAASPLPNASIFCPVKRCILVVSAKNLQAELILLGWILRFITRDIITYCRIQ